MSASAGDIKTLLHALEVAVQRYEELRHVAQHQKDSVSGLLCPPPFMAQRYAQAIEDCSAQILAFERLTCKLKARYGQECREKEAGGVAVASTPVNPAHYRSNGYGLEAIEVMRRTFGDEDVATFCRISAFQYRLRAGLKEGNPAEQDLAKEAWYLDKCHALSAAARNPEHGAS